ncbi:MAG: hypothetical protein ACJAT2_000114 [Bacteriovoracaceae bacterium]|jgi:hypothetical protein
MLKIYTLLLILLLTSCATGSNISGIGTTTLRFIGDKAFPVETTFNGIPFGGISGISYDPKTDSLLGVSDDRSSRAPARFYEFKLIIEPSLVDLKILNSTVLKAANGKSFPEGEVDFEALTFVSNNRIAISSEGDNRPSPRIAPWLAIFNRDGSYSNWIDLPSRFLPEHKGELTKGPRNNLSFESLGATRDFSYLFTATEDTIFQDGELATSNSPGVIRILRYKEKDSTYVFDAEFPYKLEAVPTKEKGLKTRGHNGLVDILPFNKKYFLTMERAWVPEERKQTIKIYKVTIEKDSTRLFNVSSLKDGNFKFLKKELVADLDDFVPLLTDGKKKLDNMEAMTFGPKLPNGNHTLLIMSDDNFNKRQRTLLLAFELL